MNTQAVIERFILEEMLFGDCRTELAPAESPLGTGILDSMALLRLVTFIEARFGMTLEDSELIPNNSQTINRIKVFLEMKRQTNTSIVID